MKKTVKIISLTLIAAMILCLFSAGISAVAANGSTDVGTVTLKTKLFVRNGSGYSALQDTRLLNCGDVIKVVVSAKTDFIAGSSSVQLFFDSTYFTPYKAGKIYTAKDIYALDSGYIVPCTKANGYNSDISDDALYIRSINLGDSGGRVNCGTSQPAQFWPRDWRDGNTVKDEYLKYNYVWVNLCASSGSPNDRNDGKGSRLVKINEQDIFAFELMVNANTVTHGSDTAKIFIPEASIRGTMQYGSNKTSFTKQQNPYSASAETPVTNGFYFDLSGADNDINIIKLSSDVSITGAPVSMNYLGKMTFSAKLSGAYSGKKVKWISLDPSIVSVDENGNAVAHARGTTKVICSVNGEAASAMCDVTVSFAWWQWIIYIVLFGWLWY